MDTQRTRQPGSTGPIYLLDDQPGLYSDTLETWERYLSELRRLPDSVRNKEDLIESAEQVIARRRRSS